MKFFTQKNTYFPELDFVKAKAIGMVVAFHFWGQLSGWHMHVVDSNWFFQYWSSFSWEGLARFVEAYFYLGVNLFVIASGFGLYLSYLREGRVFKCVEFLKKRVWRLMPTAIMAVVFVFFFKGLILGNWPVHNLWINLFPFLGGLNLFSDNWFFAPINGETWFLGLIIQLYLFFPLFLWLYRKLGSRKFLLLLFIVSALFRVMYYFYFQYSVSSLSYGLSVGRFFEFGWGMVLAADMYEKKNLSWWWTLGLLMSVGYFFPVSFPYADMLTGVGLFTLLWKLAGWYTKDTLFSKTFTAVSAQSYMIFLIHHPLIWTINALGYTDFWNLAGIGWFVILWVTAFGISWCLNRMLRFVEF